MSAFIVFQQMLVIFVLIAIGYIFAKMGRISDTTSKEISTLVIQIANPAMILMGAISSDETTHRELLLTGALAMLTFFAVIVLGFILPTLLGVKKDLKKHYNMLSVYGNYGFVGLPVVAAVLGDEAIIYVSVFVLFFNILVYTHGVMVMSGGSQEKRSIWTTIKSIINPGTVAGLLSVLLVWFRIELPTVVSDSLLYMGRSVTFLSLLIVGVSLSKIKLLSVFTDFRLYILFGIRMLLVPIATVLLMKQFFGSGLMVSAVALIMAMPAANMPLMMASERNLNTEVLSKGVVLSTLLSLVTVPIVAGFV